ncbi:transglutaminase domain-containing protein [Rudanella paleaurantiibacter]|uniref:transglutaminase domain-containing protein n=1 Tax=Rudanella paleaurantiibacter TaxID=2614655 RepID=UPI001625586A|nr:transglutaminase domain-containing protein [Rudanella paleaurantiibacter]
MSILSAFCTAITGNGQGSKLAETPDPSSDLAELVQVVTAGATTDSAKARALFLWVATHIRYDAPKASEFRVSYGSRPIDTLAAARQVLQTRKGICTDYSLLLYQLYRQAGLRTRIISGYAKGQFEQAGTPIQSINHQWNAVWLDGHWRMLDPTWASTNGGSRPVNMHYFLTRPEWFSADHFAHDPADRLSSPVATKAEFDSLPRVYSAFFGLGFGPDIPRRGLFQIRRKLKLVLQNPADMEFQVLAHRFRNPQKEQAFYGRAFRTSTGYELPMVVYRPGPYSVHVLSRPKGDTGDFRLILTCTVVSSQ